MLIEFITMERRVSRRLQLYVVVPNKGRSSSAMTRASFTSCFAETVSVGAHVLGNFPRAELVFTCVHKEAHATAGSADRYEELRELKSLLDEGIITQGEYEREKGEILSR